MFKKPIPLKKPTTNLKSSDCRKLKSEATAQFPVITSQLAARLLPNESTTTRILTHLEEPVIVYSSPKTSDQPGSPIFFRPERENWGLVPTIYTLNKVPNLLPVLVTAESVFDNLLSGSALFASGISLRSVHELPDNLLPNSLVAISIGDGTNIIAVGILLHDKLGLLKIVQEASGKAVATLHTREDHLWKLGSGISPTQVAEDNSNNDTERNDLEIPKLESEITEKEPEEHNLSPSEASTILLNALMLGLSLNPVEQSALPLPAASLYASHVLPSRPVGSTVEVKKSSYKNVKAMFKTIAKTGVITIKENKGEVVVTAVKSDHELIEKAPRYKTLSQLSRNSSAATELTTTRVEPKVIVDVTLVRQPTTTRLIEFLHNLAALSKLPERAQKENLYTVPELKSLINGYIKEHDLTHKRDGRHFILDQTLAKLLHETEEEDARQERETKVTFVLGDKAGEVMPKTEIVDRIVSFTTPLFIVSAAGKEPKVIKGSPTPIRISLKHVGKRMMTRITGHEPWRDWGADLRDDEVVEELRKKAAGSASVVQIHGTSPKNPKFEIMVQGAHDKLVTKFLIERGVPKDFIVVSK